MTIAEKNKLINMGNNVVIQYAKTRNDLLKKQGYVMNNSNYMLAFSITAFKKCLKVDVLEVTWDEACEIFDVIAAGAQ